MNVAVVGLGIIGSRVAANVQKAGFEVRVWNRTPKEMAGFEPNLAKLAAWADVVQIFVRDHIALLEVTGAMLPAISQTPGKVVINSATVSREATVAVADQISAAGALFLDAPFTGSREAAAGGQLVYYVGGDQAVLEAVKPVLQASSKEIILSGKVGDATLLKIATNMVSAVSVQVLSEAMRLVEAHGLPTSAFEQALASNASGSMLAKMKLPTMQAGDFQPHFSLKNMLKDSLYALELGDQAGLHMPALRAASQQMQQLNDAGEGDADYSVLYKGMGTK
jgi:3-hydroxyisobutyrate dehydrogenase-like beta-hydroxyacid dehydrogenase